MRVQREYLFLRLSNGHPLGGVLERAVGKTTGAILQALVDAIKSPGSWVSVDDPDMKTEHIQRDTVRRTEGAIASLGLKCMEVRTQPYLGQRDSGTLPYTPGKLVVYVRSKFAEVIS